MTILHRSGVKHTNADGLSRIPDRLSPCNCYEAGRSVDSLPCGGCSFCKRCHLQWERFEADVDDVIPIAIRRIGSALVDPMDDEDLQPEMTEIESYSSEQLREKQLLDSDLAPVLTWLQQGEPSEAELFIKSPIVKHLWKCKSQLELKDGVLFYKWDYGTTTKLKLVIPESLKQDILSFTHDTKVGGHFGRDKTLERARNSFYWLGMSADVKLFVATCNICSVNKKLCRTPRAELQSYQAGTRLERVHLDFLGPFVESESGNKYILMIVDQFTKWVSCIPLPDQNAKRMAWAFYEQFICFFGCPLQIHTDQGRNFDGHYFKALCDLLQVVKTRTTPYRPSSNGQVERYNRVVLQFVRCFLDGKQKDWDKYIASVAMSIRSTVNKSTGFTPNFLMFGQELNMPVDILMGLPAANNHPVNHSEHAKELESILKEAYKVVRENLEGVQVRQKKTYDIKQFQRAFQRGDLVYKVNSATKIGVSKKLSPIFTGPYLVIDVLSPALYRVEDRKRTWVVHHDKLLSCQDRSVPFWIRAKRHQLLFPEADKAATLEEGNDLEEQVVQDRDMESTGAIARGTVVTDVPGMDTSVGKIVEDGTDEEAERKDAEGTVLTEVPNMDVDVEGVELERKDSEGTVLTEVPNMDVDVEGVELERKDSEGTVLTDVPNMDVEVEGVENSLGLATLFKTRSGRSVRTPGHLKAYQM